MAAHGALSSASHRSPSFAAWRHRNRPVHCPMAAASLVATTRARLREIASGISELRQPLWKPLQDQPRWPEWLPRRDGRSHLARTRIRAHASAR